MFVIFLSRDRLTAWQAIASCLVHAVIGSYDPAQDKRVKKIHEQYFSSGFLFSSFLLFIFTMQTFFHDM